MEYLQKGTSIFFDVSYHSKGNHATHNYTGSLKEEFEEWLAYSGLVRYFISDDIYYCFGGTIELVGQEIIIKVSFSGPMEDEFHIPDISMSEDDFGLILGDNNPIGEDFDPDNLTFNFDKAENDLISNFEVFYCDKDGNFIDLLSDLDIRNKFERYCDNFVLENLHILNLEDYITQSWDVRCYENKLSLEISTSTIELNYDDVKIGDD